MAERLHVFTSAAVNYLPKVRALCRSVRKYHPEAVITLALADERPGWLTTEGEPFDRIVDVSQLEIPNWRAWTFFHNIVELSTAIKPFALKHLFKQPDCGTVLYLDPDIVLFSRLDDMLETLRRSNVVLTPHQTKPELTQEAVLDNEVTSLRVGVFNLGFIGVRNTPEGRRFADWWSLRTYHFCRAEIHHGLFTDQKWINFAPIFFEGVTIVNTSRFNVATWNLTTRSLTGDAARGFAVDGQPLGFYHFTGFDSGAHKVMAVKNARGNESVQELIAWYEREIAPVRGDPVNKWPWAFGQFSDGMPVQPHHRWMYREALDLQRAFPNPYATGTEQMSFLDWSRSEGRVRFPWLFGKDGGSAAFAPAPAHSGISPMMAVKLFLLMFTPKTGRSLRHRLVRMLRREGLGGLARRLRGLAG